jgi:hypothetical protein
MITELVIQCAPDILGADTPNHELRRGALFMVGGVNQSSNPSSTIRSKPLPNWRLFAPFASPWSAASSSRTNTSHRDLLETGATEPTVKAPRSCT